MAVTLLEPESINSLQSAELTGQGERGEVGEGRMEQGVGVEGTGTEGYAEISEMGGYPDKS